MSDKTDPILVAPPKGKRPKVTSVAAKKTNLPEVHSIDFFYVVLPSNAPVTLDTLQSIKYIILSTNKESDEYNIEVPLLIPGITINSFEQSNIKGSGPEQRFSCVFNNPALFKDFFKGLTPEDKVNVVIVYNVQDDPHNQTVLFDAFSDITLQYVV